MPHRNDPDYNAGREAFERSVREGAIDRIQRNANLNRPREMRRASNGKMVPVVPALPEGQPDTDPNPIVAICGECNLELRHIMHLACQNNRCPMRRKGSLS